MMSMSSYLKDDVILVRYPFADSPRSKVDLLAVVVSAPHISKDVFIVPLTSRTESLLAGEYVAIWLAQVGAECCNCR